jgi:hypothetical protein
MLCLDETSNCKCSLQTANGGRSQLFLSSLGQLTVHSKGEHFQAVPFCHGMKKGTFPEKIFWLTMAERRD